MRILVSGGLGFIGSNFIRYVLSKHPDYEIINLDKVGYGANLANLKDVEGNPRYRFVKGSITDFELVKRLVKEVDAVVNFAAETHVDRSLANPWPFFESNTLGVFTLLEAIRTVNRGVRLLHVSTDEVYGDTVMGSFKETDPLRPSSPYSASKAAADLFVLAYYRSYGLDVIVSRCTNNFGPFQFPEKLIPKTIIRALMGLKIPIYGTGKNVRDWIYVLDHVEALDLLLQKGRPGVYNISGGNELENIEVVKRILKLLGKDESLIEFVEDRPGHDVRYSLDSSKIRSELGWSPRYSFDEGIKETVRWYVENEWWWRPLVSEKILHPTPWRLPW
jgi:dTDP-glucose 4,6-dehydratase